MLSLITRSVTNYFPTVCPSLLHGVGVGIVQHAFTVLSPFSVSLSDASGPKFAVEGNFQER